MRSSNEAQARALAKLKTPKERFGAWELVLERTHDEPITAAAVESVVSELTTARREATARSQSGPAATAASTTGATAVSTLNAVPTPRGTSTWFPLAHRALLGEVQNQLKTAGFSIGRESHALSHEGRRYFGVMEVKQPGQSERDYAWVVGLRNSHDKSFPAGLVAGTSVFTCDNLAFSGEVKISRKHTRFAHRDLRHLTARAVGRLGDRFQSLDRRIDAYRHTPVANEMAHDLVIRAVDCAAITPTQIADVIYEWRESAHREFRPRNLWSLFNAFTEIYKGHNPSLTLARSQALHGLFDGLVGIN